MSERMHEKSADHDLFFCVTRSCRVVTFIASPAGRNICPRCNTLGALVRREGNKLAENRALVAEQRSRQDAAKGNNV